MQPNISFRFGFKVRHVQTSEEGLAVVISSDGQREEGDIVSETRASLVLRVDDSFRLSGRMDETALYANI